jgi:HTH-type transcriptional regulator/antitoxin HigA
MKVIKTKDEHEQALQRVMVLMDKDPVEGSSESDELELLALLIESYEAKHYPIDPPDPIEAIKFRMEQQGLKQKDLTPYFGSASKVSEVLNGTRKFKY